MIPVATPRNEPAVPRGAQPSVTADDRRALTVAARARLAAVCVGWSPDQFAALVADVVRFRERWDWRAQTAERR